jgi:hypothetical protein
MFGKEARVVTHFQCSRPWDNIAKAIELIDLLQGYDDIGVSPERYGSSDARTFELANLQQSDVERIWMKAGGGHFKRKLPWNVQILVFFIKSRGGLVISHFWLWLDASFFQDSKRVARYLDLCKEIYSWGRMDHGYVAHEAEYVIKNRFGPGSGVGGANLRIALPGIYWANFFGPIYTEWFGEDKFQSLATHYKEKLPDGGWLIVTCPSVLTYDDVRLQDHEKQMIRHLGEHAFFEMDNPDKQTKTPFPR